MICSQFKNGTSIAYLQVQGTKLYSNMGKLIARFPAFLVKTNCVGKPDLGWRVLSLKWIFWNGDVVDKNQDQESGCELASLFSSV